MQTYITFWKIVLTVCHFTTCRFIVKMNRGVLCCRRPATMDILTNRNVLPLMSTVLLLNVPNRLRVYIFRHSKLVRYNSNCSKLGYKKRPFCNSRNHFNLLCKSSTLGKSIVQSDLSVPSNGCFKHA